MINSGEVQTRLSKKRPVIFGEVLFDSFPDGSNVLGGAPFNVAWHLQGLGAAPLFISRIGNDARGDEITKAMSDWGLDATGLQQDVKHPTGLVQIELNQGQPTFSILPDQAYDYIDSESASQALHSVNPALLYYGTLIGRSESSAQALVKLKAQVSPQFVDINLRDPWWTSEIVAKAVSSATWVKLNDDEIKALIKIKGRHEQDLESAAHELVVENDLQFMVLTRGEEGAFIATKDEVITHSPFVARKFMDAVGAGDAFSAVTLFGLMENWPLSLILERALQFAAAVCEIRGATTKDKDFYSRFLKEWTKE